VRVSVYHDRSDRSIVIADIGGVITGISPRDHSAG
jgi:hypothetical protein